MAPPDWVYEKRLTPDERKQAARIRMTQILEKQAQEARTVITGAAPAVQSPFTPVLGVTLRRLPSTDEQVERDGPALLQTKRKRSSESTTDAHSRRGSVAGSAKSSDMQQAQSPATSEPPKRVQPTWYSSINPKKLQLATGKRDVDAKLEQVKNLIKQCNERRGSEMGDLFDRIRDELHVLVFLKVTDLALRRKRMLHDDSGLPQLFENNGIAFPWDIQADALELYNRWALQDFSIDLLRGIIKKQNGAGNRSTDRIDPAYPGKAKANYHGEGSLVNGQWWPTQLCTVRDGAHGSTQGGIYATKGNAAYSIVLSGGNHYKDRDQGEEIWYSGTDGRDGKASENTQSLQLNISNSKDVRVIRSHNLAPGASTFRPPRGFRYDGLYEVLSYQVLDPTKMSCLFHLRRKEGQDPIRFRGKEMRPTAVEISEYDRFKAEIEASERI